MNEADLQRFFSKVGQPDENGCVTYLGALSVDGYGVFWLEGKQQRAHRIAWLITNGPIPENRLVLHKCDNRWCIAVDHLFIGTNKDNLDDMVMKGRDSFGQNRGLRNGHAKLTEDKVRQIYALAWKGVRTRQEIGEMFGVSRACVWRIKYRQNWKHLWVEENPNEITMNVKSETETLATGADHG